MEPSLTALTVLSHVFLGGLLVITGLLKFPNIRGFVVIVATYQIFPRFLNKFIGYTTPFVEVILGLWLLLGFYPTTISTITLLYFISLMGMAAAVMLRGNKMSNCGCYGTDIKVPMTWWKVLENAGWSCLALSIVFAHITEGLQLPTAIIAAIILFGYGLHRVLQWKNNH